MINRDEPLGRVFNFLGKDYIGVIANQLAHLDIERYFYIMVMINQCGENATQQYVADKLGINKTAMVRVVDYLVARDFIQRTANKADRREYRLELTEKATLAMPDIIKTFSLINATAFKGLSTEQINEFYMALEIIQLNLSTLPAYEYKVNYKKQSLKRK